MFESAKKGRKEKTSNFLRKLDGVRFLWYDKIDEFCEERYYAMSLEKRKLLHISCGIVLSVLLTVTGVLLILSCVGIYRQGGSPFTRESVGAALSRIAVPGCLTLFGIVATAVLRAVFPLEEAVLRADPHGEMSLSRLKRKGTTAEVEALAHRRRVLWIMNVIALVVATAGSLIFLLNAQHYPVDAAYNDVVIACALWTVLWFGFAFIVGLAADYACRVLIKQEMRLLREATEKAPAPVCACPLRQWLKQHERPVMLAVRCGLLVAAAVLIVFGILHGGMADVLGKAINICTECIGLG